MPHEQRTSKKPILSNCEHSSCSPPLIIALREQLTLVRLEAALLPPLVIEAGALRRAGPPTLVLAEGGGFWLLGVLNGSNRWQRERQTSS
jgi:hypothetical protein